MTILLALAAIIYGCYLVTPALGWGVGGFFALVHCVGKYKIAQEEKRQQRVDTVTEKIMREYISARCGERQNPLPLREHRPDVQ